MMLRIKEWDEVPVRNLGSDCVDYVRVVDGKEEVYTVITAKWAIPSGPDNAEREHTVKILVPRPLEQTLAQPYLAFGGYVDYIMPTSFVAEELKQRIQDEVTRRKQLAEENEALRKRLGAGTKVKRNWLTRLFG